MARLTPREAAILRMAMHDEARNLGKDDINTSGEVGAEYPRMLYRATTEPDTQVVTENRDGTPRETTVRNSFGGMLCDVIVADDADEAEALSANGWDVSPAAAHGKVEGMVAATTAKDDEIAALRAELAAMQVAQENKRGPGRPPKALAPADEVA